MDHRRTGSAGAREDVPLLVVITAAWSLASRERDLQDPRGALDVEALERALQE